LSGGYKLETLLDEDAYKEMEHKRARVGIMSAVAWMAIPDDAGPALANFLHLPPMDAPTDVLGGLPVGNTVALGLFLMSVPKCALLGDYWNSVKQHCDEECEIDLDGDKDFDPLGLRKTKCVVNEAARRAVDRFSEDHSPSKTRAFADPEASPSKRLRLVEREFERPAAMLVFLYVLELLASNTCVLRETSMIFDAVGNLAMYGLDGDIQVLLEKWLQSALEVSGNVHDMLHSFPLLSSKVDALAQMSEKMCDDAGHFGESFLRERLDDKFRLLEVDLQWPGDSSGAA
jgi:hypothetical protein